MIEFRKILVPMDFSEPSRKALTYGLALAVQFNAKLVLAHVVPESSALSYAFPVETIAIELNQRNSAVKEIQTLVPPALTGAVDLRTIVKVGSIDDVLLEIVKDEAVDLVVLGTHGRRNPGHWIIGSVTERILRKVPTPILTVSHLEGVSHAVDTGVVSLKRILYATDLTDSSGLGLRYSVELAQQFGAELTVLHVVEYLNLIYEAAAHVSEEAVQRLQESRKRLDDYVRHQKPAGVRVQTLVLDGKPYERILEAAENGATDLIVLNLQSKGLLERAFLGSTAERVIRLSHIPVLSVPVNVIPQESVVSPIGQR